MVNDVIEGHVTSKFLKIFKIFFLLSSKNMRQHFSVKYVKTKLSFGPNGRKIDKIYHRGLRHCSREQIVPSSSPAWTSVLR